MFVLPIPVNSVSHWDLYLMWQSVSLVTTGKSSGEPFFKARIIEHDYNIN